MRNFDDSGHVAVSHIQSQREEIAEHRACIKTLADQQAEILRLKDNDYFNRKMSSLQKQLDKIQNEIASLEQSRESADLTLDLIESNVKRHQQRILILENAQKVNALVDLLKQKDEALESLPAEIRKALLERI